MRRLLLAAVLVAFVLPASHSGAATFPDGGVTGDEVADALREQGYTVELSKDPDGDPKINFTVDGINSQVYFFGCSGDVRRCDSIQFVAGFAMRKKPSLEHINEWNRDRRFARAYLDDEDDPWVEVDVDTERGFTSEALAGYLAIWKLVIPDFKKHIDY